MPKCCDWTEMLFDVKDLCENRLDYANPKKLRNIEYFLEVFPAFIEVISKNENITRDELEKLPYFDYLVTKLNKADRLPKLKNKGKRRVFFKMKDAIKLFYDIKNYGLKAPLDMHYYGGGKLCLVRGGRRLVILNFLGYKKVPVRIFSSYEVFLKLCPSADWESGPKREGKSNE